MYVIVDNRPDVRSGYAASFRGEGFVPLGFSPEEFREWFPTVSDGDVDALQSFLIVEFEGCFGCLETIRSRSRAPIIALSDVRSLEKTLQLFTAGIDDVVRKPVPDR